MNKKKQKVVSAQELLQRGIAFMQSGKIAQAESAMKAALNLQPQSHHALHILAVLSYQQGKYNAGLNLVKKAIAVNNKIPEFHNSAGIINTELKKEENAKSDFEKAIELKPDYAEAYYNFANLLKDHGNKEDALAMYNQAIRYNLDYFQAHNNLGNLYREMGRLDNAVACFNKALEINPRFATSYSNLADTLLKKGKLKEALSNIDKALEMAPNFAEAHNKRGAILKAAGSLSQAKTSFLAALKINPDYSHAYNNLGTVNMESGHLVDAIENYKTAIRLTPEDAGAYNNLGSALLAQGKIEDAIIAFNNSIKIKPENASTYNNLGRAYKDLGNTEDAIKCFEKAIYNDSGSLLAYNLLGNLYQDKGKESKSIPLYEKALSIKPENAVLNNNFGNALRKLGLSQQAINKYKKAIELQPNFIEAYNNLGSAFTDIGETFDAIEMFKKAYALKTDYVPSIVNLLLTINYSSKIENEYIYEKTTELAALIDIKGAGEITNVSIDKQRKLKIGYVSGDFSNHPIGYFIEAVLTQHNKSTFDVTCYSNSIKFDDLTKQIKKAVNYWRNIHALTDDDVAEMIMEDKIDILVDLSGYTNKNRLPIFARRNAPVQVTWLGYFATTGLKNMDYILADKYVLPEGEERYFTETVRRLPDSYLCFVPPSCKISVEDPPSLKSGQITFGCFNNFSKLNPEVFKLWSEIMHDVPGSRLFLKYRQYSDDVIKQKVYQEFFRHGIKNDRIIMEGSSPREELLKQYNQVDIALDPFLFGGGTTTAESVWMGVPVVTLRGNRWVGRVSESILSTMGHQELIANSSEDYKKIAVSLSSDSEKILEYKNNLRKTLLSSPLCNGKRFARNLEGEYRKMWQEWCDNNEINS